MHLPAADSSHQYLQLMHGKVLSNAVPEADDNQFFNDIQVLQSVHKLCRWCVCMCVCVCVCALCMYACVRACACVFVHANLKFTACRRHISTYDFSMDSKQSYVVVYLFRLQVV